MLRKLEEKKLIRAINDKDTALHEAARYHQTEVVKILTEEDPDHSYLVNNAGETPVYISAETAYWDVVLKIVENCKSPNHDGPNGRTTLHAAVIHNNKEIGSKLLTRTLVEKEDENGWIPLHLAAIYGSPDLTELVLNYDKTIAYRRDRMGRTAFHLATYFGHVNVMKMIMSYCPDCPELVENKGRNALHYAVERNELMAARIILEDPSLSNLYNEKDEDGNTPFQLISKLTGKDLHSLLQGHPRVDQLAFNQQNQIAFDVAIATNEQGESSKADVFPNIVSNIVPKEHDNIIETATIRQTKDEHDNTIETATISQSKDKHDSTIEIATINKREQEATISERKQEDVETATLSQKKMEDAKTIETTFLVATLIATVTFAAGFTLPGGTFQEGDYLGSAILKHNLAFQAFVISDCIAMVLSASAVLMYLFLTFGEVRKNKDRYINYGFVATILTKLAMVSMIIAFVTGTYAVLGASKGIGLVTLLIGLSFFLVLCILVLKTAKYVKERSDS